jgi:hypothetical protein
VTKAKQARRVPQVVLLKRLSPFLARLLRPVPSILDSPK